MHSLCIIEDHKEDKKFGIAKEINESEYFEIENEIVEVSQEWKAIVEILQEVHGNFLNKNFYFVIALKKKREDNLQKFGDRN